MGLTAAMTEDTGTTQTMRAQVLLREQILAGEVPAGTRLLEVALAEKLRISRTPVRDALARLAEEGLLDRVRGGGFVVRTFTFDDVVDAIELRGVLEGTAARLAAERGTEASRLRDLRKVVAEFDLAFDEGGGTVGFADYAALNARFHELLWALAGSAIVARELHRVARLPFASPSAFLHGRTGNAAFVRSLVTAHAQHHALIDAIVAREGARAEAIAREHARIARRNLEYAMRQDRDLMRSVPGLALVVE